jgi:predicted permease
VLVVRVEPKGSDQRGAQGAMQRLDRIYTDLLQRVREIPGVRSASLTNVSPLKPTTGAGMVKKYPDRDVSASAQMIYPGYFEILGMPLVRGRDFNSGDISAVSPPACIVNETFARSFFPGEDPIGKPCGGFIKGPGAAIIGVVKDSKSTSLKGETPAVLYAPFLFANTGRGQMILYVRAVGNADSIIPQVREAVWTADKSVPQFEIRTLAQEVDAALIQDRLIAALSSFFSVLALSLACVGLYGLLSFAVVQRTSEVGVRIALGALGSDVVWMVMREALVLVFAGILVGVPAALAAARFASSRISGLLFGLKANDPLTIAVSAALIAAVAACAAYLPARRASHVDPMVALRNE